MTPEDKRDYDIISQAAERFCEGQARYEPGDFVNECWLKLPHWRASFDKEKSDWATHLEVRAWLYCGEQAQLYRQNPVADHCSKRGRQRRREPIDGLGLQLPDKPQSNSFEELLEVLDLNHQEERALRLRFEQDYTLEEIAEALEVSTSFASKILDQIFDQALENPEFRELYK